MSEFKPAEIQEPLAPEPAVGWLKTTVAAAMGTAVGTALWLSLKAYTDVLASGVLPSLVAVLLLAAAIGCPVYACAGERLRRMTYAQVLPLNAFVGVLGVALVLGGEYFAWWLSGKPVVWDVWLGGAVSTAVVMPLALGPHLWEYLAESIEQIKQAWRDPQPPE